MLTVAEVLPVSLRCEERCIQIMSSSFEMPTSLPDEPRPRPFAPRSQHGLILARHRQEVLALAQQHGFSNVRVFGSTARGTDHEDSDIDLLVDRTPAPSMFELGRFEHAISLLLNLRVDLVPANGLKPEIAERVLNEAVSL